MSFLTSRTPRERGLIICAAILIFLFLIWQVGAQPILAKKAQAAQSEALALRDFDIVQRGVPQIRTTQTSTKVTFSRTEMIAAARNANIAISRVQPASDQALQVWFEDTESSRIYNLLADLSARFNVDITRVQMTRRDTGRVSAQVTLAPQ